MIWRCKNPRLKLCTLCIKYENGTLKDVDISLKIKSLKICWVRRLFDSNYHELKVISLFLINVEKDFGLSSNLKTSLIKLNNFPVIIKRFWTFWVLLYTRILLFHHFLLPRCFGVNNISKLIAKHFISQK